MSIALLPRGYFTSCKNHKNKSLLPPLIPIVLFLAVLLVVTPLLTHAACGGATSHPFVGFSVDLSTVSSSHSLTGTLTITTDCTFRLTQFSFSPGEDSSHYWWGSASSSASTVAEMRSSGKRISSTQVSTPAFGYRTVTVELASSETWASGGGYQVLALWSETFEVPIATIPLSNAANTNALSVGSNVLTFDNCAVLKADVLQLHWTVDTANSKISFGLEGKLAATNYMSFGVPSVASTTMVGGDVVLAGFVDSDATKPFVADAYMSGKSTCSGTSGVCPDTAAGAANSATLEGSNLDSTSGIMFLKYSRGLAAVDTANGRDVAITLNADNFILWAYGGLASGSTTTTPLAQYHGVNRVPSGTKINFSTAQYSGCKQLSSTTAGTIETLSGVTTFDVTLGNGANYPNNPGPGISFYINGKESPVLNLAKGTKYTFNIKAGSDYPFYITSDVDGANSNSAETVFAGDSTAFGTSSSPKVLEWTPGANTPDTVYYQSTVAKRMGWKITFSGNTSPTPTATTTTPASTTTAAADQCTVTFGGVSTTYSFCSTIFGSYKIYFSTLKDENRVDVLVEATGNGGGWVAYAKAASATTMAGANAIIGWVNSDGSKNINTYVLGDRTLSSNDVVTNSDITNMDVEAIGATGTRMRFSAKLSSSKKYRFISPSGITESLAAVGTSKVLAAHSPDARKGFSFDAVSGSVTVNSEDDSKKKAHVALMMVGWGICLPLGILLAIVVKGTKRGPWWFYTHITVQVLGLACILSGFIIGLDIAVLHNHTHFDLGITALSLGLAQLLALVLRPKPDAGTLRMIWNIAHKSVGLSAIIVAWVNSFEGLDMYNTSTTNENLWIACLCIMGGLVVLAKGSYYLLGWFSPPVATLAANVDQEGQNKTMEGYGTDGDVVVRTTDEPAVPETAQVQ
eukprot:Nk52_evm10s348 gene=Nk52_evmTU10s348